MHYLHHRKIFLACLVANIVLCFLNGLEKRAIILEFNP